MKRKLHRVGDGDRTPDVLEEIADAGGAVEEDEPAEDGRERDSNKTNKTKGVLHSVVMLWPVNRIKRFPNQPRKTFPKEAINSLAHSIVELGEIINPLIVTPPQDEFVELVDGEMRWRAAIAAGIKMVPVTFNKNVSDVKTRYVRSCIANFNKTDMAPLDIAVAIQQLIDDGYNQTAVAKLLGKTPGWVSNMLKLLNLKSGIRKSLVNGEISLTIATLLARYPPKQQRAVLREVKDLVGGQKVNPTQAPIIVAQAAAKVGAVPNQPQKCAKDFRHLSAAELLARRVARQLGDLSDDIFELNKLPLEELRRIAGGSLLQIEDSLKVEKGKEGKKEEGLIKQLMRLQEKLRHVI